MRRNRSHLRDGLQKRFQKGPEFEIFFEVSTFTGNSDLPRNARAAKKAFSCWAKMLKRVFNIEIQTCLKCGGEIKIISAILSGQVIKKILSHLGENSTVPELSPSRGPPEEESFVSI